MALQHDVPAVEPDGRATQRIGQVQPGHRREGGGRGEHFGVGGRNEARIWGDGDQLLAILGCDDEAEASAGAGLAQLGLDALLKRNLLRGEWRRGGEREGCEESDR